MCSVSQDVRYNHCLKEHYFPQVVELLTRETGSVTLAIGDGANDVAMIQKANVGVGIAGLEGLQAACASDYAIGQVGRESQGLKGVH